MGLGNLAASFSVLFVVLVFALAYFVIYHDNKDDKNDVHDDEDNDNKT